MPEKLLVVDDDRQLTSFLDRFLTKQGYQVSTAGSGTQMGLAMEHRDFDLLLLDVGLPDTDGFEITRELRRLSRLPIILLTARDEVYDKIIGLEIGADDYVAKPFEPRELLARVRSVLRRAKPFAEKADASSEISRYSFSGFVLDVLRRRVSGPNAEKLPLTAMEFRVLRLLVEHAGSVVSRDRIMQALYGNCVSATDRAIDAHVARLRKKLAQQGSRDGLIQTVHGTGYALAAPVLCS